MMQSSLMSSQLYIKFCGDAKWSQVSQVSSNIMFQALWIQGGC